MHHEKYLNLYQRNILQARVKTIKLITNKDYQKTIDEEAELVKNLEKAEEKHKLKKQRKAEEKLEAFRQAEDAKNYAYIEDTGLDYYILKYNFRNKKAEGIIQK